MTGSASATFDWNSSVIALLVIGSIRWFGFILRASGLFDSFFTLIFQIPISLRIAGGPDKRFRR